MEKPRIHIWLQELEAANRRWQGNEKDAVASHTAPGNAKEPARFRLSHPKVSVDIPLHIGILPKRLVLVAVWLGDFAT